MEPFDRAWELLKAPFRGTSSKYYDEAVEQGFIPARQVEKDRKGIWATNDFGMAQSYSSTAGRDEQPVVHHLPESIEGIGEFDHYAPKYGYYPFDIPIEHSQEVWRGPSYEEWRRQRMQEIFDAMDANRFPTPKEPNMQRYQNAMMESANAALRDFTMSETSPLE
jgi:hypothetical protein